MKNEEIKDLIHQLEASKLRKIIYKKGDFELHLEKDELGLVPVKRHAPVEMAQEQIAPPTFKKEEERQGSFITSPMVGTYYASPSPDQPHFVKVGDKVTEGTIVCIIEAMKVMNEVKAGISGTVAEILFHNGQPVEFGSRLFRIVT